MNIVTDGNWFSIDPATTPVAEAAASMLSLRLAAVVELLPRAAKAADPEKEGDVEHVHQLRVSCRRAAAAERAFRPLAARGRKRLHKWLQRIRRAAGPARDADVLIARMREELDLSYDFARQVLARLEKERREAQDALVKLNAKTAEGKLVRAIDRVARSLASSDRERRTQPFGEFGRDALRSAAENVVSFDAHTAVAGELHGLRIAAKRLRYAIELFHSGAKESLRTEVYPQVEEVQERLGLLNDRASAQLRFQGWLADLPADGLAAFVAQLVISQRADAERLRDEFLAWWLPDRQNSIRQQLHLALE